MKLELDANEVQFILNVLGEMPAKSGVWPLILKIKEQQAIIESLKARLDAANL